MSKPVLLLFASSEVLLEPLKVLSGLNKFRVIEVSDIETWETIVREDEPELTLCWVDEAFARHLNVDDINRYPDFILLSDGAPNSTIDGLMRKGAGYHFRPPFEWEAIDESLQEFADLAQSQNSSAKSANASSLDQFGLLVGSSRVMRRLYRSIHRVAASGVNVLVLGESGVGKELVSKTLHLMSDRSEGPYIAINCGAMSPELVDAELFGHVKGAFTGATEARQGLFERAHGGTLFLDEITEMPIEQQVKLLRVLETGEFRAVGSTRAQRSDVRIIAASNRDPAEAVRDQHMREDLFYRLAQFPVSVPTLRERDGDISGLALHFLSYRNQQEKTIIEIEGSALQKLEDYDWPGNVRELKHTIERAYVLCQNNVILPDDISLESPLDLSESSTGEIPVGMPLEELEQKAIEKTLQANDGNKTETADQLGISVKTLYNKLEKYRKDA